MVIYWSNISRMLILIMESFSSCQETGKVFSSEMPFYSALHFNNNAYSGKVIIIIVMATELPCYYCGIIWVFARLFLMFLL